MDIPTSRLSEVLANVTAAEQRFIGEVTTRVVDDATAARPSRLPGWTVGHVLTHIARNADSCSRRVGAAMKNETAEQYAGGYAGRSAEIEAGAARSARELLDDLIQSSDRLTALWPALTLPAWVASTLDVAGNEIPLWVLPERRWLELELHLIDLDLGFTHDGWSSDLVDIWLPRLRPLMSTRLPDGVKGPTESDFEGNREELAWLFGRLRRPDLPLLAPWG